MAMAMGEVMRALSREVRELSLGDQEIERVQAPLSPVRFLRDFVMPGKPCIVTGAIGHWEALRRWSNEYLRAALCDQPVSVHFTPDGRADSVVNLQELRSSYNCFDADDAESQEQGEVFVSAHVETMPFQTALEAILQEGNDSVAYAQQQNDCFRSEYSPLWEDAELHIPWVTEALGAMPEAVNLWIGNERAVTSFHKDHYENLYAVVSGEKQFTLLPPVDVHRLYVREYPSATYTKSTDGAKFLIKRDPQQKIPWVSVDPYPTSDKINQARQRFPKYFEGDQPFRCTVRAGEILYLPSLWFHHVSQKPDSEGRTIAINFWYDMQFDIRFAYFNFLQSCLSTHQAIEDDKGKHCV